MVVRLRRTNDCKMQVELSLAKLGYKVQPRIQESVVSKECIVTFSDVPIDIYTDESYDFRIEICIELNIDNNNEFPYVIMEIVRNVTRDVEDSETPWCTGFRFTKPVYSIGGEMINVRLFAEYPLELDWIEEEE